MPDKARVYIVDDEKEVRRSTGFLLKTSGYSVETFESGNAFLKEVGQLAPGCVLLDVRMPDLDGLEVQQIMRERGIRLPVVVFTGHGDVATAVRAMREGAIDFLEKPFEKADLLASVEMALAHLQDAETREANLREARVLLAALTPREQEILSHLARGLQNKAIAYDLNISPRTVEVHRAHLMQKLGVRSFSEALRIAFAAGIDFSDPVT